MYEFIESCCYLLGVVLVRLWFGSLLIGRREIFLEVGLVLIALEGVSGYFLFLLDFFWFDVIRYLFLIVDF